MQPLRLPPRKLQLVGDPRHPATNAACRQRCGVISGLAWNVRVAIRDAHEWDARGRAQRGRTVS
eukprot:9162899-Pyramimonas_sp.AAC.1